MEEKDKISIHQILWYLVIFSIIGLIVETLFCYITTGVIESRKGLIYGPFCPIYGVGATFLIYLLNQFKNDKIKLFIYGGIGGSAVEYIISYGLESFYGARFWDYSYLRFNLNGRICVTYTIFWGILAIVLIKIVKPIIDKIICKIDYKILDSTIAVFIMVDVICTIWGINVYRNRAIKSYYGIDNYNEKSIIQDIENDIFDNKKMKETFPNLRFINENGEEIWIRNIL